MQIPPFLSTVPFFASSSSAWLGLSSISNDHVIFVRSTTRLALDGIHFRMPKDGNATRDRIIDAAARLFYQEGIRAVSVDAVAGKAKVTKKTLYYHFNSKDELIEAYLKSQDQSTFDLYARWFSETDGTAADKVRGLFAKFGLATDTPRWKGCGFLRTTAELASMPGHPAIKVGAAHKKRFEAWLGNELRSRDVPNASAIARQVLILLDGAATVMMIHRDVAYVQAAGTLAGNLVAASQAKHR
jgi:AcrR family transcriptional regulator